MSATDKKPSSTKKAPAKQAEPMVQLTKSDLQEVLAGAMQIAQASQPDTSTVVNQALKESKQVVQRAANELNEYQERHAHFVQSVITAPKGDLVQYRIPKVYKQYLGTMKVCWNGAVIYLKADGIPRKIHKGFIPIIEGKLRYLDNKIDLQNEQGQYAGVSMYAR